jgi:hypothetical protein
MALVNGRRGTAGSKKEMYGIRTPIMAIFLKVSLRGRNLMIDLANTR